MNRDKQPTVRPRYVWLGLILGLIGAVVIGLGISFESWAWAIAGIVVLAIGGALALLGGVIYDAHPGPRSVRSKQALHGDTREGIAPGDMVDDPKARETSLELHHLRLAAEASTRAAPRPPMANLGAVLVLLVGVSCSGAVGPLPGRATSRRPTPTWRSASRCSARPAGCGSCSASPAATCSRPRRSVERRGCCSGRSWPPTPSRRPPSPRASAARCSCSAASWRWSPPRPARGAAHAARTRPAPRPAPRTRRLVPRA